MQHSAAPRPDIEFACITDSFMPVLLQDLEGLPGDVAGGRAVHSHRYAGFDNGDEDSDDDDDLGRAFESVSHPVA